MTPEITTLDEFAVRGKAGEFSYSDKDGISALWMDIGPRMMNIPGVSGNSAYGVIYDSQPATQRFTYLAGIEADASVPSTDELTTVTVPAGKYAMYTFDGHIKDFQPWLADLWQNVVPASGLAMRDGHVLERYDERWDPETSMGPVDLFIPIG